MIKDIFRPEDFEFKNPIGIYSYETMAEKANARFRSYLEENSRKVYSIDNTNWSHYRERKGEAKTHTAYLIGVEEIKKCSHEKEKVDEVLTHIGLYRCACGAKLKPETFRAIGESNEVKG